MHPTVVTTVMQPSMPHVAHEAYHKPLIWAVQAGRKKPASQFCRFTAESKETPGRFAAAG